MKFYILENLSYSDLKKKDFNLFDFFKKNKVQYSNVSYFLNCLFKYHYHIQCVSDLSIIFVINNLNSFIEGAPYMLEIEIRNDNEMAELFRSIHGKLGVDSD